MPIQQASAQWRGDLKEGQGHFRTAAGGLEGTFSFGTRMEGQRGSSPEELIGAAHAGCFSMALAHSLSQAGFKPERVETIAKVHFDKTDQGFAISGIDLETQAQVPGMSREAFEQQAEKTKVNCPVSRALSAVPIHLKASLVEPAASQAKS